MSANYVQCRYLRRSGEQCTAEALDASASAEILLCAKHAGRVIELVRRNRRERG